MTLERNHFSYVIPTQAGISWYKLDSRFRGCFRSALPLCKGEKKGVERYSNAIYPPQPSLTKGGNEFGNRLFRGNDFSEIV